MSTSSPTLGSRLRMSEELREQTHGLYKKLHSRPELSMQEHKTAGIIREYLETLGIEVIVTGGTGVVGVLRNGDGPVVGFRADTDGLPIAEDTGHSYASTATGTLADGSQVPVMHGCGHDTHIAALLAAATMLTRSMTLWAGTIVFIFQPGEETGEGAKAMVNDGLWDKAPKPEIIFGQHVWPTLAGTIDITPGDTMAMADSWKVTVYGRGGHGSQPHDTVDPILLGAHMIVRIQSIVSREVAPQSAAVVTIATFNGGLKENIIPSEAEFTVNVRSLDPKVREDVLGALRRIISAEARASGAPEPVIEELNSFPRLYNEPTATAMLTELFREHLGVDAVRESPPRMGSEDFGYLAESLGVPSVYWFFGGHPAEKLSDPGIAPQNHSPQFAPALEPTLTVAAEVASAAILSRLAK
jgi:amidohydrolase